MKRNTCAEAMPRKQPSYGLALLVGATFASRVVYCALTVGLGHASQTGYTEYAVAAQRLLEQGTLVSPMLTDGAVSTPSALMPPGYVVLLAGLYGLFGVKSFPATLVAQLINAAAAAATVALVYDVARRLQSGSGVVGRWTAWGAAWLVALNPILLRFTTFLWDTNLFTLGVMLSVWLSIRLSEARGGTTRWLGFGFFLGGLALLNPALTIAYPLLVLWPAVRSSGWRLSPLAGCVGAAVLGWLVAIAPWTVRNASHFDRLIYVRSGFMHELWLGVCPEADRDGGAIFERRYALRNKEVQRRLAAMGEQAFLADCGRRAKAAILEDPSRLLRLIATRALDYWAGTVYSHVPAGSGGWPRNRIRAAVMLFASSEVLAVILLGVWLRRGLPGEAWWLILIASSFSLVYCITHVELRYRAPIEPILALILASLLSRMFDASARVPSQYLNRNETRPLDGRGSEKSSHIRFEHS